MVDQAPVKNETAARQGQSGMRTLGVLEWSLGLVVLCFAALLLVAVSATQTPRDAGAAPVPQSAQPAPGNAHAGQARDPSAPPAGGTQAQGER